MKKLILAFAIAISGLITACGNHTTTEAANDTVAIEEVVTDSVCNDSCACDTVCVDTCVACNQ